MLNAKELDKAARAGSVELCGLKIALKPYNDCDEWFASVVEVDAAKGDRGLYLDKMAACVADYCGQPITLPVVQLVDVYQTLKAVNDPFAISEMIETEKGFDQLSKITSSGMPAHLIEKMFDVGAKRLES